MEVQILSSAPILISVSAPTNNSKKSHMSSESQVYDGAFTNDPLVKPQILRVDEQLFLQLEWLSETEVDLRTQRLPLPRIFDAFSELSERPGLIVNWINGTTSKKVYAAMLDGFSTYVSLRYPGFCTVTPIKTYAERPHDHDQNEPAFYQRIPTVGLLNEIAEFAADQTFTSGEQWTGAFSNVVIICPEPGPNYNYEGKTQKFIFPAIDFDIDATGDAIADLSEVATMLAGIGFSGYLIESGDPPNGGYQFLADFMMPYTPNMWQSLGILMKLFTNFNRTDLMALCQELIQAPTLTDAREIMSRLGPDPNVEAKRSFPVSMVDWGYCWHQIREGMCKLRALQSKNYTHPPRVIAQIK